MAQALPMNQQLVMAQNIFSRPLTIFGLPVNKDIIFRNHKGGYKAGIEKRQRKLIAKTTFVDFFLHQDECICCMTTGFSPVTVMEQLFTGPAFLFFKRAIFIFTNERILHIPARVNHSSPSAISQIRYEDCTKIGIHGRSLVVQYNNGEQETFPYISRKERQRIKMLLGKLQFAPKADGRVQARAFLCPSCTRELTNQTSPKGATCSACKLQFKSGRQANIRALVLPGGGYFYNRYPVLGFIVGSLEAFLTGSLAFQLSNYFNGIQINEKTLFLVAWLLLIEKMITAYHSRQLTMDYIPEEAEFAKRKM